MQNNNKATNQVDFQLYRYDSYNEEDSGCRSDQSDQFFRSIRLSFGKFIIET